MKPRYIMVKQIQCDDNGNILPGFHFERYAIIDKWNKHKTIFSGKNPDNCVLRMLDLNERLKRHIEDCEDYADGSVVDEAPE